MKALRRFWIVAAVALCAATTYAADLPAELRLTNGVTLKKPSAVRWAKEFVVVRHVGGVDTIRYANIAEGQREAVLACRAASEQQVTTAQPGPTISGQVFLATKGAGSYRFGSVEVVAYKKEAIDECRSQIEKLLPIGYRVLDTHDKEAATAAAWIKAVQSLEKCATATTDADGFYSITLPPSGDYVLMCSTHRMLWRYEEYSVWVVPAVGGGRLDLNNDNKEATFQ